MRRGRAGRAAPGEPVAKVTGAQTPKSTVRAGEFRCGCEIVGVPPLLGSIDLVHGRRDSAMRIGGNSSARPAQVLAIACSVGALVASSAALAVAQGRPRSGAKAAAAPAAPAPPFVTMAQPCPPIRPPSRVPGQPPVATQAGVADQPAAAGAGQPEGAGAGSQGPAPFRREPPELGVPGRGVLGGVCLTAADSMVQ